MSWPENEFDMVSEPSRPIRLAIETQPETHFDREYHRQNPETETHLQNSETETHCQNHQIRNHIQGPKPMASSSTSVVALTTQVMEKPTHQNYILWRAQILPQVRSTGLYGLLDGSDPEPAKQVIVKHKDGKDSTITNPEHAIWVRQDQLVLGYLLNNLTKEVLIQVVSIPIAAAL